MRPEERAAASAARERRTRIRATGPQASLRAQTQHKSHDIGLSRQWWHEDGEGAARGRRRRVYARPVRYHGDDIDEAASSIDEPADITGASQSD